MKFTFLSLFPQLLSSYFEYSILKRAKDKDLINIDFIDIRDFSSNKHKKVDDYSSSGGSGMLMGIEAISKAILHIKSKDKSAYFVIPSPCAKRFNHKDAKSLACFQKHIVFICGRYEGLDERVFEEYADEIFSIGDFVLTGGELPSLAMSDCISRHTKGVLGNENSLKQESFENDLLEYPSFTKPNNFNENLITSEFLKGNHARISSLKNKLAFAKTQFHRPDIS